MDKVPQIVQILNEVWSLSPEELAIVDYWDVDPEAGGICRRDDPKVLSYVRIWETGGNRVYFVENELPSDDPSRPYDLAFSGDLPDVATAVSTIARHLRVAEPD